MNKEMIFNSFINDFRKKNNSIISDLFYAVNCNITECSNCHIILYNYQTYFFIVFPLEQVLKFKNQSNKYIMYDQYNNNINVNHNEINIYDCFDFDKSINIMNEDNNIYCHYCKNNCNCMMSTNLVTGPEILIIILNRGKGMQFNININFFENINLCNYIEYKNTGFNYQLIGVITYLGEKSMSGNFIAYCRDPVTKEWNKYNDSKVSKVNNFQAEVINFVMPYFLFYQKIKVL